MGWSPAHRRRVTAGCSLCIREPFHQPFYREAQGGSAPAESEAEDVEHPGIVPEDEEDGVSDRAPPQADMSEVVQRVIAR